MKYEMRTTVEPPFMIKQELVPLIGQASKEIEDAFLTWVYDTRDKGLRKALIKLGWTPPKEKS